MPLLLLKRQSRLDRPATILIPLSHSIRSSEVAVDLRATVLIALAGAPTVARRSTATSEALLRIGGFLKTRFAEAYFVFALTQAMTWA